MFDPEESELFLILDLQAPFSLNGAKDGVCLQVVLGSRCAILRILA